MGFTLTKNAERDFRRHLNGQSLCVVMNVNEYTFWDFPFHMQYGMLRNFFNTAGVVIDYDTYNSYYKIWDYTEGEPDEPIYVDVTYEDTLESGMETVIKEANKIYNEFYGNI